MSGEMENWSDIAAAKEIPQAVIDSARERNRRVLVWVYAVPLVLMVAFDLAAVAMRIVSPKEWFLEFIPMGLGLVLFWYFLPAEALIPHRWMRVLDDVDHFRSAGADLCAAVAV